MTANWSWCLTDRPSLQDLLEVQRHFGLPIPALVEKDWHVVKAIGAISAADTAPARLVFGGGTTLSRAHRPIRRMSEDIDLRIISDSPLTRPALRHLRDTITDALLGGPAFSLTRGIRSIENPATRAAIPCIACPIRRLQQGRGSCGRRSKLRQPYGRCGFGRSSAQ